jgi:hypothetical protein
LQILESNLGHPVGPFLPGIQYAVFHAGYSRLLSTRLGARYRGWLFRGARRRGRKIGRQFSIGDWKPEAILTVAHGNSWLTAAEIASRLNIPLHLIVHDDPYTVANVPPAMLDEYMKRFGEVYRSAASRLCVSPYMAEKYLAEFGIAGDTIYPSRAPGGPAFSQPPDRLLASEPGAPLTFAYAGSIHTKSYAELLRTLADVLGERGHQLLIFSNISKEQIISMGLDKPHVSCRSTIPFMELISLLREQVDVLFVPMSFAGNERRNMEVSFPSKLTDYTAVGLPLLICGPEYCSAIKWAQSNPGVAEVSPQPDIASMRAAVERLTDVKYRRHLATEAIRVGSEYFSHERVVAAFNRHLMG